LDLELELKLDCELDLELEALTWAAKLADAVWDAVLMEELSRLKRVQHRCQCKTRRSHQSICRPKATEVWLDQLGWTLEAQLFGDTFLRSSNGQLCLLDPSRNEHQSNQ